MVKHKRNTLQRQLVLDALRSLHTHATAEEVHAQVARQHPHVSLATVYRNLNSLAEDGEARKLTVPSGADRFDFQTQEHYHLLCRSCGRFVDAPIAYRPEMLDQVQRLSSWRMEQYSIVFEGICPACIIQKVKQGQEHGVKQP